MRIVSRIAAFIGLAFLLSLPVLGADEKDKKKADAPKGDIKKTDVKKDAPVKKAADKKDTGKKTAMPKMPGPRLTTHKGMERDPAAAEKKMMSRATVTATVMAVVEDKKSLRLKLTIPYVKINTGALNNYNNAYMSLLRATNAQGVYNAQQQMAQAEAQIYQIATTDKQVEWTATDDVKVRMRTPPAQFDDKGRIKRYTAKELKELKGNDKLPFYPGEFSDIKTGQIVSVTLLKKKASRPVRRGEAELLGDNLPHMSMIIILLEPKN